MTRRILSKIITTIMMLPLMAGGAWGMTAANSQIVSTAVATYKSGASTGTARATTVITVIAVAGVPSINAPTNQTTPYAGPGSRHNYSYTITANGNGPATYTITATVDSVTNSTNATATVPQTTVTLGATVTSSGSSANVLVVPSDGTTNASVNGITVGAKVVVGDQERIVTAITDPAAGNATINLNSPLPAPPAAGVSVYERKSADLVVQAGAITNIGAPVTIAASLRPTGAAGTANSQITSTFTVTTNSITKYARNVSSAAIGNALGKGGKQFTFNGVTETFYTGGVTGKSGDVIEYLIVAENSGSVPTSESTIKDTMPIQITTFRPAAYGANGDMLMIDENGREIKLTQKSDTDTASIDNGVITLYAGTGATASTGGSIAPGKNVKLIYQANIN
jgi:hypothetical protein